MNVTIDDPERLRKMVAELGEAIASGDVMPKSQELEAIAVICSANNLSVEAARVRGWNAIAEHAGRRLLRSRGNS